MSTKDALLQAITTFDFTKDSVTNALNVPTVNERNLSTKLAKFEKSLSDLNSAHTLWVSKSKITQEALAQEVHSKQWLQARWGV